MPSFRYRKRQVRLKDKQMQHLRRSSQSSSFHASRGQPDGGVEERVIERKSVRDYLEVSEPSFEGTVYQIDDYEDDFQERNADLTPLEMRKLEEIQSLGYIVERSKEKQIELRKVYYESNYTLGITFSKLSKKRDEVSIDLESDIELPKPAEILLEEPESNFDTFMRYRRQQISKPKSQQYYECPISRFVEEDQKNERIKREQTKFKERDRFPSKWAKEEDMLLFTHRRREDSTNMESVRLAFDEERAITEERKKLRLSTIIKRSTQSNKKLVQVIRGKGVI